MSQSKYALEVFLYENKYNKATNASHQPQNHSAFYLRENKQYTW